MKKILLVCLFLYTNFAFTCTHFRLIAKDNSVVIGRSMEFGPNLKTEIYTVHRGTTFDSQTPDGKPGMHWETKHGYLALNGFHLFPVSGINEQGLSFDLLYFPGLAQYETYNASTASKAMPYYQIADYLLGNFSNTDEIKQALPTLNVYAKPLEHAGQSVVFPVHYVVTDKNGKSIAIEYVDGKLNVYDNTTGILTNSPSYPWQTTNLNNYVNLSPHAPDPIIKDGVTYNATGQGGGAVGLPGDYTPPSRFIRTAYLVSTAKRTDDALTTVNLAEHILNNVDIPYGAIRGPKGSNAPDDVDFTQWVVIKDLTHHTLYFRSYADLSLQKIEMDKLKFDAKSANLKMVLVDNKPNIIDATKRFMKGK
ncbi:MAG: choloylglycine hydrolase family protein [Gammaproteobacteria bacterium]|nr:choloylglycine hydrolase family protein [Gammaproteobacteria bacterium]